jgi:hypothetical protein
VGRYALGLGPLTAPAGARAKGGKGSRSATATARAAAAAAAGPLRVQEKTLEGLVFDSVRALRAQATVENITQAVEDKYDVPPKFREQLRAHLKALVEAGKLVRSKQVFSLPPRGAAGVPEVKMAGYRGGKPGEKVPEFLVNGKRLTAEEIAEEAQRAVVEAEEAAAAAEVAAREAEEAEAEAQRLELAAHGVAM